MSVWLKNKTMRSLEYLIAENVKNRETLFAEISKATNSEAIKESLNDYENSRTMLSLKNNKNDDYERLQETK
jgi:hypothetical protein